MIKKIIFACSLSLFLFACSSNENQVENKPTVSNEETVRVSLVDLISLEDFEGRIKGDDDGLVVYNFWATWCKPCIAEMPYFEKVYEENKAAGLKLVFVSIDKPSQLESRLIPFLEKQKLLGEVILPDAKKTSEITKIVSPDWKGNIPATLIVDPSNDTYLFYRKEFDYEQLKAILLPLMAARTM